MSYGESEEDRWRRYEAQNIPGANDASGSGGELGVIGLLLMAIYWIISVVFNAIFGD